MSEREPLSQGGYGSAAVCGECGRFHADPLAHQRDRDRDRRRVLLDAARSGATFVAESDFQAAGVGATRHLLGPGRTLDEWRSRSGSTVRFSAGQEVDAAMVRRLMAEGRDVPVRVVQVEPGSEGE